MSVLVSCHQLPKIINYKAHVCLKMCPAWILQHSSSAAASAVGRCTAVSEAEQRTAFQMLLLGWVSFIVDLHTSEQETSLIISEHLQVSASIYKHFKEFLIISEHLGTSLSSPSIMVSFHQSPKKSIIRLMYVWRCVQHEFCSTAAQ